LPLLERAVKAWMAEYLPPNLVRTPELLELIRGHLREHPNGTDQAVHGRLARLMYPKPPPWGQARFGQVDRRSSVMETESTDEPGKVVPLHLKRPS
jgi:hypothetical protein